MRSNFSAPGIVPDEHAPLFGDPSVRTLFVAHASQRYTVRQRFRETQCYP